MRPYLVIAALHQLSQIEIDAIRAYTQAIERCRDQELARTLTEFRKDHLRHIQDLSVAMRKAGGLPPEGPDLPGLSIETMTAAYALTGSIGALMAMQGNEIVTNDAYAQALARHLPDDIRAMVERNAEDERRHLAAIRGELAASSPAGPLLSGAATMRGWLTRSAVVAFQAFAAPTIETTKL
jgi:rubrerythrin